MKTETLTADRLRSLLDYAPETGLFTWRRSRGRIKAGSVAGSLDKEGYVIISIDYKAYKAHRLAWMYTHGAWPLDVIDHLNCDASDNRISNLREANASINAQNQRSARKTSRLGVLGVSPWGARFRAQIQAGGQKRLVGVFDTREAAHDAYLQVKRAVHAGCTL